MIPAHELRRLQGAAGEGGLDDLIERRLAGEPLQYLEGTVQFGPVEVVVDPRVLIPRPETEYLWEQAVAAVGEAGHGSVIVDLCTGSGAVALALKHRYPQARVIGSDVSEKALEVAAVNSELLSLEVEWLVGDVFDALPQTLRERIDLITANPPYVSQLEYPNLPRDVRHEPYEALVAGPEGTELIQRIAEEAFWWLGVGGLVFCEIGETHGELAAKAFGVWLDVDVRPDLTGRDRYVVGRKGAPCCV